MPRGSHQSSNTVVLLVIGGVVALLTSVILVNVVINAERRREQQSEKAKQEEEERAYIHALLENRLLSREELIEGAENLAIARRFETAAAVYERAAQKPPPSAELWLKAAENYRRAGLQKDAEAALAKAEAIDGKGSGGTAVVRARMLQLRGKTSEAISTLRQAIAEGGGSKARAALVWLYVDEARLSEAEAALDPELGDPELDAARGYVLLANGKVESALVAAKEVAGRAPDCASAVLLLGLVRQKQGVHADAARLLQRAAVLDPDNPKALMAACDVYWNQRNYQAMDAAAAELSLRFPEAPELTEACDYDWTEDDFGQRSYFRRER